MQLLANSGDICFKSDYYNVLEIKIDHIQKYYRNLKIGAVTPYWAAGEPQASFDAAKRVASDSVGCVAPTTGSA